jgi:hypothetical protein
MIIHNLVNGQFAVTSRAAGALHVVALQVEI